MKGGIKPGSTAWDEKSLRHDKLVRQAANTVYDLLSEDYPKLKKQAKLKQGQIVGGIGACQPDGGVWFYDDKLIAAFEAKKQNNSGNAIERWYKNYHIISQINDRCPLVTFAIGEGVREGSPIWKALYSAHQGEYDTLRSSGPSCFLSPDGFTFEELVRNMKEFIVEELRKVSP